ncbi:hypothetical protein [Methyloglobulus sp.]|uniref:hypothetical protein n=1 Tax=Methyloglobulus sp. TaxID=2518622 RepID=UPI0032B769A9
MDNNDSDEKNTAQSLNQAKKVQAKQKKRGYSDFFAWPVDRQLEEWAIVDSLKESLEKADAGFFNSLVARGQGNDPPDCEAMLFEGGRLGIEVTELVDPVAIMAHKNGDSAQPAQWNEIKLVKSISQRLEVKDASTNIKGGPYERYILVIHTDEPALSFDYTHSILSEYIFNYCALINRAFLLMSYDEKYRCCPFIELNIKVRTLSK